MHLAIIGDNRPRLYWSMLAAQALGGVPVPMYQDAPAAELVYVLNDAEIAFAIVEDQEQVDKMLEAKPHVPTLAHISTTIRAACATTRASRASTRCRQIGREFDRAHPGLLRRRGGARAGRTTCRSCSTPRARPASRRACGRRTPRSSRLRRAACGFDRLTPDDSVLSYLPMAWVGDHLFSFAQWVVRRASRSTAPSRATR